MRHWLGIVVLGVLGCGSGGGAGGADAAAGAIDADTNVPDAAIPTMMENEPNNGAAATEVNFFSAPVAVTGAIDPGSDIDIFAIDFVAGQSWRIDLESSGSLLAPHVVVNKHEGDAPRLALRAAAGDDGRTDFFVLQSGRYNLIARDARNVPDDSGQGGATHTYTLRVATNDTAPQAVSVPSTTSSAIPTPFRSKLFSFSLVQSTDININVLAARKAVPSDLDTRLSLFYVDENDDLITNDDLALDQTDSFATGVIPAGDYVVVVDNLNESASDLSFDLEITTN